MHTSAAYSIYTDKRPRWSWTNTASRSKKISWMHNTCADRFMLFFFFLIQTHACGCTHQAIFQVVVACTDHLTLYCTYIVYGYWKPAPFKQYELRIHAKFVQMHHAVGRPCICCVHVHVYVCSMVARARSCLCIIVCADNCNTAVQPIDCNWGLHMCDTIKTHNRRSTHKHLMRDK